MATFLGDVQYSQKWTFTNPCFPPTKKREDPAMLDDRRVSILQTMTPAPPARHKVQARERTQKEGSSLIHVESEANRALRHQG